MTNPFIPNDTEEIKEKIKSALGIQELSALFSDIPEEVRLKKPLHLPNPLSEAEVRRETETILKKNRTIKEFTSFLGGGIWAHYVPAVVDEISSRSEFLTSYTPYQPEINQGLLQTLFEYQSLLCELVGMEVVNCSMYDWASSLGEAARMTARITKRNSFIIPQFTSPERLATLQTYTEPASIRIIEVRQKREDGQIDLEDLKRKVSNDTCGVYVENPSYLGFIIKDVEAVSEITHDSGGLFVVGVDPMSLGVFKPPGDYGADIVVGEGQPLGNYMNSGGPLLGIFACRDEVHLVRQMPGRIIGMTTTKDGGERAFCLALQTREQHIRRERATSNICTNEALCAVRAAVYMALLGPDGFRELGENILSKTQYAIRRISEIEGLKVPLFDVLHFKEFTVNFDGTSRTVDEVNRRLLEYGILGGKALKSEFPQLGETVLYSITETHTRRDIEDLKRNLRSILEG